MMAAKKQKRTNPWLFEGVFVCMKGFISKNVPMAIIPAAHQSSPFALASIKRWGFP
jgi:hypothetical protein